MLGVRLTDQTEDLPGRLRNVGARSEDRRDSRPLQEIIVLLRMQIAAFEDQAGVDVAHFDADAFGPDRDVLPLQEIERAARAAELLARTPADDVARYSPQAQAVQMLISPTEMGDRFKVMALGKGIDETLLGFVEGDRSETL